MAEEETIKMSAHVDRAMHDRFRRHYPHQGTASKLIRLAVSVAVEVAEEGDMDDESVGRKLKRALK